MPDPKGDSDAQALLEISRLDDDHYRAQWTEHDNVTLYQAYPSLLSDSILINVKDMSPEAQDAKWVFLRYSLGPSDRLNLSIVADKAVASRDEVEGLAEIRRRVAEKDLYHPFALCIRQKE